jgi:DNA-binding transcriptional regulator YdaS (Cro superfamily)
MSPLEQAISICGSQAELARRMGGKTRTGHIYYWLKHGLSADAAVLVEAATGVRCEVLLPHVVWTRDESGRLTGYHVATTSKSEAA